MPNSNLILVVDDNTATRYAIRRTLERHGFRIEEAGNGATGLARLAEKEYAALILDVNLPDMSGFDVVRQLREQAPTRVLPVIHVSAVSIATGDMITGLDAGADAYLVHPVDQDVLLATLRTLLRVRRAEEALRASEARFREIFETIGAPIAVVDATLRVHESNDAFVRLLGDVTGEGVLEGVLADQPGTLAAMQSALAGRERWRGTFTIADKARTRVTEWRVSPYRNPDLGLLSIEDVTDQHDREREHREELEVANTELAQQIAEREHTEAQLAQAQKMEALGKLTGGIAHDFNNLLTSIISGLDMISLSVADGRLENVPKFAEITAGSAHRAAALTQRMLAFARKQSLDSQTFNVVTRIRSLEDLLRRSIGENIALELDFPDPVLLAVADPNQFENVILNLVINARDAMGGRGLVNIRGRVVHAQRDLELEEDDYVSIQVIDNGHGIAPDVLAKVFEPFFTTKPQGEGTGLGLSMTYGFARQSGGSARISSQPGAGTTVELLLPRGQGADASPEKPTSPPPPGRSERVLLVDDTDVVRVMMCEMLRQAGYRIIDVGNARDALEQLRSHADIDVLITDVGLPGMNGRDLADAARELRPTLPVLFITGYTEEAESQQAFLGEGMSLLLKPFNLADLLRAVRAMLV